MIGTSVELDILVILGNFITDVVLIPTLINRHSYIPKFTSLSTTLAILIFAFVFLDEGLIWGGIAEIIDAVMWLFILMYRGKDLQKK